MRRPGKHSASPLSSSAAASTAKTTNVVSKTEYKMTWKNAVLKIGKQKLAGPVADNPEDRKSGKTTVIAVIDDDSSRAVCLENVTKQSKHHPSKSLLSRKKSISKMGKRVRTSFFDAPQTKVIAKRFVSSVKSDIEMSPNSEINDGERSDSNTYEVANRNDCTLNSSTSSVSSPIVAQPYTCNEEEQTGKDETEPFIGSSVSSQLCSCLAATQSSAALHNSNKGIENLNEETENLLEENEMLECSTITNNNRELTEEEKHMILVDFDAGMLPHEIEEKYGVSKLQIADVLSNRISIFRTNWSDLFTLKRRRTVYVRLNMQMWNYFCQCRDQKIWLNGRQLKEQALKIAHELGKFRHLKGLFKASEGWLDSFKRRHCIDLKAMTGKPVIYEADPEDANSVNDGLEIKISRSTTPSPKLTRDTNSLTTVLDANKFLMDAADAAVLASADRSDSGIAVGSPTQATVAIGTTSPLDIQRLLPGPSAVNEQNLLLSTVHASEIGASSVQALLETCCYRVNEIEVAQAIDTLRAYIVSNNINLLPVLVELQKSLAAIAAQRRAAEKMSSGI
uniref:HTH CENPB-type domain-containing protein n=1 Tax=Wuchereria bancrofti TaxID=6293 RepID=A0A1I8EGA4_WUCBA